MKLLIAGGGTGGHVIPAIAIAREWLSRGVDREVVLVGTQRGMEMKLVPQAGLPLETLRVAGLKGKGGMTLVKNLAMVSAGCRKSGSWAVPATPIMRVSVALPMPFFVRTAIDEGFRHGKIVELDDGGQNLLAQQIFVLLVARGFQALAEFAL